MSIDYAIAMDRLCPNAHYHRCDNYRVLSDSFSNEERGHAQANAALGYTMPTKKELEDAYAEWKDENDSTSTKQKDDESKRDKFLSSDEPTDLDDAKKQIQQLKKVVSLIASKLANKNKQ